MEASPPYGGPEYKDAARALERVGIKPTSGILALAINALDQFGRRPSARDLAGRSGDQRPVEDVAKIIGQSVAVRAGMEACIEACRQSYTLSARRLEHLDIPAHPSVQDVAHAVVVDALTGVIVSQASLPRSSWTR